jgi:WD repeat-containing protein 55
VATEPEDLLKPTAAMADEDIAPPDVALECQPLGLSFHPLQDVVAVALIDGTIELHTYTPTSTTRALKLSHHTDSCRAVEFSVAGDAMFSVSADKALCAVDANGQLVWREEGAHDHAINCLALLGNGIGGVAAGGGACGSAGGGGAAARQPDIVATGDDEGVVKVWDVRTRRAVMEFHEHTDFISDFEVHPDGMHLLATSGDCTLSVMDLRQQKLLARSEDQEDELMSCVLLKHAKKILCGTTQGLMHIFSWGQFADMGDRFAGHPASVDTIIPIDEQTVATGSSDGLIRICQIQPNKLLGVVGDHDDNPVELLKWSRERALIGSLSHDDVVHFWDVRFLQDDDDEDEDDEDEGGDARGGGGSAAAAAAAAALGMDGMDDDDDEQPKPKGKGKGKKKTKAQHMNEDFFEDL